MTERPSDQVTERPSDQVLLFSKLLILSVTWSLSHLVTQSLGLSVTSSRFLSTFVHMNRSKLRKFSTLLRYLLVLGVIGTISLLFPNNLQFKYQFERGKVWRYEDLAAPFDFAIKKTEPELNKEQAQIKVDFSPYYELNTSILGQQKKCLRQNFRSN